MMSGDFIGGPNIEIIDSVEGAWGSGSDGR
jgi:hypothetical protein